MAIQGIISGFAAEEDLTQHAVLLGRGSGYSLVVNGRQVGEQESSLEGGMRALAKACEDKPLSWRDVRGTVTDGQTGVLRVTELGRSVMGDFDLKG